MVTPPFRPVVLDAPLRESMSRSCEKRPLSQQTGSTQVRTGARASTITANTKKYLRPLVTGRAPARPSLFSHCMLRSALSLLLLRVPCAQRVHTLHVVLGSRTRPHVTLVPRVPYFIRACRLYAHIERVAPLRCPWRVPRGGAGLSRVLVQTYTFVRVSADRRSHDSKCCVRGV